MPSDYPPQTPTGEAKRMEVGSAGVLARLIAEWMDEYFTIPGTRIKVGWNPLLDLIPGVGDVVAMMISALTLVVAAQARVPRIVLVRMGLNIALTAVVGLIPIVGELFTFWFRPSRRNYELLKRHVSPDGQRVQVATWGDWVFVSGLIGTVVGSFVALTAVGLYWMVRMLEWVLKSTGIHF